MNPHDFQKETALFRNGGAVDGFEKHDPEESDTSCINAGKVLHLGQIRAEMIFKQFMHVIAVACGPVVPNAAHEEGSAL